MSHPLVNNPSPAVIREHLLPEDVERFDQEFHAAVARADETLDLTDLIKTVESWRRVAMSSTDPERHRKMLARAEELCAENGIPWTYPTTAAAKAS